MIGYQALHKPLSTGQTKYAKVTEHFSAKGNVGNGRRHPLPNWPLTPIHPPRPPQWPRQSDLDLVPAPAFCQLFLPEPHPHRARGCLAACVCMCLAHCRKKLALYPSSIYARHQLLTMRLEHTTRLPTVWPLKATRVGVVCWRYCTRTALPPLRYFGLLCSMPTNRRNSNVI